MSLDEEVSDKQIDDGSLPSLMTRKPRDVVFIADTSFLVHLSNNEVWARSLFLMTEYLRRKGRDPEWHWPVSVSNQYNRFYSGAEIDNYGILKAQDSLTSIMMADIERFSLPSQSGLPEEAFKTWEDGYDPEKDKNSYDNINGPGSTDLSIIELAIIRAKEGAEVYVASSDGDDILGPLRKRANEFSEAGLSISPLPPASINWKYFNDSSWNFRALVTGEAIRGMRQTVPANNSSYPALILEKRVKSKDGGKVYDVGVAVTKRRFNSSMKLSEFEGVKGDFEVVPVVGLEAPGRAPPNDFFDRIDSRFRAKRYAAFFKNNPAAFAIIDEGVRRTVTTMNKIRVFSPMLRADIDYLHQNSSSAYAREKYTPPHLR
jgi:hypothetical protein